MRLYFSFCCDFKKLGFCFLIGEETKHDLVGYGYDIAPILQYLLIRILFVEIIAGNLSIQETTK